MNSSFSVFSIFIWGCCSALVSSIHFHLSLGAHTDTFLSYLLLICLFIYIFFHPLLLCPAISISITLLPTFFLFFHLFRFHPNSCSVIFLASSSLFLPIYCSPYQLVFDSIIAKSSSLNVYFLLVCLLRRSLPPMNDNYVSLQVKFLRSKRRQKQEQREQEAAKIIGMGERQKTIIVTHAKVSHLFLELFDFIHFP